MNQARIIFAGAVALGVALGFQLAACGEEPVKKSTPEERRLGFERLKKELEAFKPADGAERDEIMVYLQQVIVASTKFAKENPQTPEGFEAAAFGSRQLFEHKHPKSGELAQVALDAAPTAGVEQRQVAICWMLVANDRIVKSDFKAAREALEKMKNIAPDLYEAALRQLNRQEKDAAK